MGDNPVGVRHMIGLDVSKISELKVEPYSLSKDNFDLRESCREDKGLKDENQRIAFQLDDRFWIWDWMDGNKDIESHNIYKIHEHVSAQIKSAKEFEKGLFNMHLEENEIDESILKKSPVVPIVYLPTVVSKIYIRQIHCAVKGPNVYEISIVYNNEELQKHKFLNGVYELFRKLRYHRVEDIETFRIYCDCEFQKNIKKQFQFENIYSDKYGIEYDDIHCDPPPNAKLHDIKYEDSQHLNPVIFINTSNHAMAESDNNHDLWKWEYIPFVKDSPIEFGTKTREEIEQEIRFK